MNRACRSIVAVALLSLGSRLSAQHAHERPESTALPAILRIGGNRVAFGTAWLPDSTRRPGWPAARGAWSLALHGNAFGQYVDQRTIQGDRQLALTDWEMFMAGRAVGAGAMQLSAMTSIEAPVLGTRGYPLLLQSGQGLATATLRAMRSWSCRRVTTTR